MVVLSGSGRLWSKVLQARIFMSLLGTSHENAGDDAGWRDALTAIRSGVRDAPARWESIFGPLRAGLVDDLVVVAQSVGGH